MQNTHTQRQTNQHSDNHRVHSQTNPHRKPTHTHHANLEFKSKKAYASCKLDISLIKKIEQVIQLNRFIVVLLPSQLYTTELNLLISILPLKIQLLLHQQNYPTTTCKCNTTTRLEAKSGKRLAVVCYTTQLLEVKPSPMYRHYM